MNPKTKDLSIARTIKKDLKEKLGDRIVSVIMYGSRARGQAKADSDLDLFVLMGENPTNQEENIILDTTYKYLDSDNIYISAIPYSIKAYQERKPYSPVLHWIEQEGITV